jgi:hypothetical protein
VLARPEATTGEDRLLTPSRMWAWAHAHSTRLAWALWILAVVSAAVAIVLVVVSRSISRPTYDQWTSTLLFLLVYPAFPTVGLIIAVHRPANPLGWLLLLIGLILGLNDATHAYADYTLAYRPGTLPAGLAVGWVSTWNWTLIYPILPFLFLLFPDGRLPSRRWRPLGWAIGVCSGLVVLLAPFRAGPLEYFPTIPNPLGIPAVTASLFGGLLLGYFVLLVPATVSPLVRFSRARGEERQQLKWVAFAGLFTGIELLVGPRWLPPFVHTVLSAVSVLVFAAAIAVAILRYRLYAIDRIINRALVYGLLTTVLAIGYSLAVLVFGQILGQHRSSLAVAGATLTTAAVFRPVRRHIQDAVDRRFNRRHYDVAQTIEAFSARLRDEVDLDALAAELLAVVDQTMQPTRASLWLQPSAETRPRGKGEKASHPHGP